MRTKVDDVTMMINIILVEVVVVVRIEAVSVVHLVEIRIPIVQINTVNPNEVHYYPIDTEDSISYLDNERGNYRNRNQQTNNFSNEDRSANNDLNSDSQLRQPTR